LRPRRRSAITAALAAAAVLFAVLVAPAPAGGQGSGTTTTTTRPAAAPPATPSGPVAYATQDGRVWVGDGRNPPTEIAQGAAIGRGGQAAVAIAPTGDAVAFIRADGSLALVPVTGGPPVLLASDAVTSSIGRERSIAWTAEGGRIAYLAVGTPEMVPPKPATPPPLSGVGAYRMPMPQGVLGNVVKVVDRSGTAIATVGDPSVRSYVGVTASPADNIMILDSQIPGTRQRYTLVVAIPGETAEAPTPFSADDAAFSPDGRFLVAVGPAKGRKELVRVSIETLERVTLMTDEELCDPSVSPDGTRVAVGAGPNCSRLKLVPTSGGRVVDVTPARTPDTATFGVGEIGWTAEGRFLTHAGCRLDAGRVTCAGPTLFLDPDTGRRLDGPDATTILPIRRPLLQDLYFDIHLRGPLEFRRSFRVDPETRAALTELGDGGELTGRLTDGSATMELRLRARTNQPWLVGTLSVSDPQAGIDRTFAVLARANVVGVRVFSIAGTWFSTEELPFATGRFNVAVRRR
jgi:hypothetical protein